MGISILGQLEFLFGSIGVTLSIFFCVLLLLKSENKSNLFLAIFLMAFALRIGKSLFHNSYELPSILRTYLLNFLFCVGPSIWLFTKYLLTPQKVINSKDWLHYLPFFLLLPFCWLIPNDGSGALSFILFYDATMVHMLVYIAATIFYYFNSWSSCPIDPKVRTWSRYFLFSNLILFLWYALISTGLISFYMGTSFFYTIQLVVFGIWSSKLPQLFTAPKVRYEASNFSAVEATRLFEKIMTLMKEDKVYLDPSLTLPKLSRSVEASPKEVSQAINQVEKLNYAQFISRFRVEEAQRLLKSQKHLHYTIAAIAYESGFNSISSFNSHFKKHTNSTARAYRDAFKN